jgi:hypothetical protein
MFNLGDTTPSVHLHFSITKLYVWVTT